MLGLSASSRTAYLAALLMAVGGGSAASAPDGGREARERAAAARNAPLPSEYVLGAGDVVGVEFFYAPELTEPKLPVRPDGKTSLKLVGDVQAAGLTVAAFRALLMEKYASILKNPELSVIVDAFESQKVPARAAPAG